MVLDIIRQAVQIKMTCQNQSLFISEPEYICGCSIALQELSRPKEQMQILKNSKTVEELRVQLVPFFETKCGEYQENPQLYRLFCLLVSSKVTGEITEEMKALIL